ncbi:MAG: S4 domain-containing protein [Bacteroidales bacterium]
MRIDKYLWTIRIFKTRSVATEACHKGQVRLGNDIIKASKEIKENDIININQNGITRSYKVLDLPKNRVGAALLPTFVLDMTTDEEKEKIQMRRSPSFERRERGSGRPTKRERREIDLFKRN